jgi:hypothetical protein
MFRSRIALVAAVARTTRLGVETTNAKAMKFNFIVSPDNNTL